MILTGLPWRSYCTAFLQRQRQNASRSLGWIRFILHEWERLKIINYMALQPQTAPSMSQFICLFASPTQLSYNQVTGAINIFEHVLQNISKLTVVPVTLPKPPKKEKDSPNPNSPSSSEMPEWWSELYNAPCWSTNSAPVRPREAECPRGEGCPWACCPRGLQRNKPVDCQHEHLWWCPGPGQKARVTAGPESARRCGTCCQRAQNEGIMAQGILSR